MYTRIDPDKIDNALSAHQVLALARLIDNRPMPSEYIPAAHELADMGLATWSGVTWFITHQGRLALGDPKPPAIPSDSASRVSGATGVCRCGCESPTRSWFAPGHDMRVVGRISRQIAADHPTASHSALVDLAAQQLPPGTERLAIKTAQAAGRQQQKQNQKANK